jgi:Ribosomal protein L7Ae/L30e/S12e/Gadd45 family
LLILAADTHPDEILLHLPVFADEHNIPTIYVTSRQILGRIAKTKRATSAVLVHKNTPFKKSKLGDEPEDSTKNADFDGRYKTVAHMMVRLNEQLHYKQPGFASEWPEAKKIETAEENQLRKVAKAVEALYVAAGKRDEFERDLAKAASELMSKGIDPTIPEPVPFDEAALIAAARGSDVPDGYRSVEQDLAEMALQFDRPIPEQELPKPLIDVDWVSSDSEDAGDDEWEDAEDGE